MRTVGVGGINPQTEVPNEDSSAAVGGTRDAITAECVVEFASLLVRINCESNDDGANDNCQ